MPGVHAEPLAGRVTLVTGASRGIGYACALALAGAGSHIIASARTPGGLQDLDDEIRAAGGQATLVPLDLREPDGLDELGQAVFQRWGRLDGLLACGAVLGDLAPLPHIDTKVFEDTLRVNVTAQYRLIRAMDPLLRESRTPRAVFTGSAAARSRNAFWGLYAASKAALEAMVQCYAQETEHTALRVNVLYPGRVRTAMRARAMPGEDPETLPTPADIAPQILPFLSPGCPAHGEIITLAVQDTVQPETGGVDAGETLIRSGEN